MPSASTQVDTHEDLPAAAFFSLLAFSLPLWAQSPSTREVLDRLNSTKNLGVVALSPNGRLVPADLAGTLTLLKTGSGVTDGTPLHPCPAETSDLSSLAWSPDGATLAVLVYCGTSQQIVEVSTADNTAHPLVTLHGLRQQPWLGTRWPVPDHALRAGRHPSAQPAGRRAAADRRHRGGRSHRDAKPGRHRRQNRRAVRSHPLPG